jgi:AcrR family transcriptional regulator
MGRKETKDNMAPVDAPCNRGASRYSTNDLVPLGGGQEGDPLPTAAAIDNEAPNGPRSRKGARTRARLVQAAKEVFEQDGFLEARISDIAEQAGLSHGSFYHYFDSKEQVFREVAETMDERLSEPLGSVILATGSSETPRERIRKAIHSHLERYREEARIMGVIEQVSRYDEHVNAVRFARHKAYNDGVADSIRRLQRREMADPELDPDIAAAALGAMMSRFAEMWLVEGFLDCGFDAAVEQLTAVFVNALGVNEASEVPLRRRPRGK